MIRIPVSIRSPIMMAAVVVMAAVAVTHAATAQVAAPDGEMQTEFQGSYRVFYEGAENNSMFHEAEAIAGVGWRLNRGRLGYGLFGGRMAFGGSSTDGLGSRMDRSWVSLMPSIAFRFLPIEDRLSSGEDPGENFWGKASSMAVMRIEGEFGFVNASSIDLGAPANTRAGDLDGKGGFRVGGRIEGGVSAVLGFANYRREYFNGSELEDYAIGVVLGRPVLPFGVSFGYRRVFAGSFDREYAFLGLEFAF